MANIWKYFEVKPIGFPDRLDMGCKKKKKSRVTLRFIGWELEHASAELGEAAGVVLDTFSLWRPYGSHIREFFVPRAHILSTQFPVFHPFFSFFQSFIYQSPAPKLFLLEAIFYTHHFYRKTKQNKTPVHLNQSFSLIHPFVLIQFTSIQLWSSNNLFFKKLQI